MGKRMFGLGIGEEGFVVEKNLYIKISLEEEDWRK